jgi:hypothetical protein
MNHYRFAQELAKTPAVRRNLTRFFDTLTAEMEAVGYINEFLHSADGRCTKTCLEAGIGGNMWKDGKIGGHGIALDLVLHFDFEDGALTSMDLRLLASPLMLDDSDKMAAAVAAWCNGQDTDESECGEEPAMLIMPFGTHFEKPENRRAALFSYLASQGVAIKLANYQPGQFREWLQPLLERQLQAA